MKRFLIIRSHPYDGSYNVALIKEIEKTIKEYGNSVTTINLISDGFNPTMGKDDLKLWGKGDFNDSLAMTYWNQVAMADVLVFPFPIWWGSMPAVLKGFIDKVFIPGKAYHHDSKGNMVGNLNNKKAVVITTMETPLEYYNGAFSDPIGNHFGKITLNTCGINDITTFKIDNIVSGDEKTRKEWISKIVNHFRA